MLGASLTGNSVDYVVLHTGAFMNNNVVTTLPSLVTFTYTSIWENDNTAHLTSFRGRGG